MSSEVKRYDQINSDGTCGICVEDADSGAYVEYADYAALEAECERLRQQASSMSDALDRWPSIRDGLKLKLSAAEQRNVSLTAELNAMRTGLADAKSARDAYGQNALDMQAQRDALAGELETLRKDASAEMFLTLTAELAKLRAELAAIKGQEPDCDIHFNSPDQLPPVDTPLLVLVDGEAVRARRPNFVERKGADLEFILVDGRTISGRLPWTYP